MIGRLTGILAEKQPPHLLIDVHGVGYEVQAPMSTFYDLPAVGERVSLHTHLVVREDGQSLYGFGSGRERQLFRALIRVSGVGPKLGLTLLSGMRVDEFIQCLQDQDSSRLTRMPGVGRKTAERLVIEMQDRVNAFTGEAAPATMRGEDTVCEAVDALVALGYKPAEASKLVSRAGDSDLPSEELIRRALQKSVK
ncbi:Holliday junction branch migration protein RuvA [Aquisalimonas sp.]|uniref:Holliday junction branch migration protein RuvA n=1 Tax=Aquisalimonas sp. TaxID=1872621 RepID=UPI0025B84723|nr:Holliday junction branch migration protein RuvA [Aquisalimonas sp.]